tara:strand:+ start:132 stop:398 length:267 start_codon:yes stop_codon:yes gene_type:complete
MTDPKATTHRGEEREPGRWHATARFPHTSASVKAVNLALDIEREQIGPRCEDCGGCFYDEAPKWAGNRHGWCECDASGECQQVTPRRL